MESQWFYQIMGETFGPVSTDQLQSLIHCGTVGPDTQVKIAGFKSAWVSADRIPELFFSPDESTEKSRMEDESATPPSSGEDSSDFYDFTLHDAQTNPVPRNRTKLYWPALVALLVLLLVGIGISSISFHDRFLKAQEEKRLRRIKEGDPDLAYAMSQVLVQDQLVAPKTAEFPPRNKSLVLYIGENLYVVRSYVDSQNRFGAFIRTHYSCMVRDRGDDTWVLERLTWLEDDR